MAEKRTVKNRGSARKRAESESLNRERLTESYRSLVESSTDSMYIVDRQCRYLFANRHHLERRGKRLEEIVGSPYWGVYRQEHHKEFTARVKEVLATDKSIQFDHPAHTDPKRHILQTFSPIKDRNAKITAVAVVSKDITSRKRMEEALRESEERYRTIIEHMEDGYYEVDLAGHFTFCNEAALKILGSRREEITATHYNRYIDPKNAKKLSRMFNQVRKTGIPSPASEWGLTGKDGRRRSIDISVSPIRDASGRTRGFRGIFRDMTERKKVEETIRHLAYHDALTGLPNRLLFHDRLLVAFANAKRSGRQLALLMLDLDEFKEVNDTLGHYTGDRLLQEVSKRLTDLLRGSDTIARLGGDEFMLLIPEVTNAEDYVIIAEKIIKALHRAFRCDGHKIRITTSIGIAIFPHHGDDADTLMKHADTAMYRAKKMGRDNYQIYA